MKIVRNTVFEEPLTGYFASWFPQVMSLAETPA
jgi:hypothetical protein